jgi:peptidyl-prolyl cis-trans isomerase B (cyclophilin B)
VIKRVTLALPAALVVAMAVGGLSAQNGSSTAKKPATPATAAKPAAAKPAGPVTPKSPDAGPVIVVETEHGTFEFETYPKDAPKTVAQIVALVKRNFYNGQRFHRVKPNFVVQWGDPMTKDMRNRSDPNWGNYGSGKPVGVAEIKRPHKLGAVAMAHSGNPAGADSQMYVVLNAEATKHLDGMYTVFGQVISGMDVVQKIKQDDVVKRMTIRPETPAPKAK